MWTAKEAREKAENSISDKTKSQLITVEAHIKNAVENGETQCYCGEYLGSQAIKKLSELGYSVCNKSNQRDGTCFLISW